MKMFSRIENGVVAELFSTHARMSDLFHPSLNWVEVTSGQPVCVGWLYADGNFFPPPASPPAPPPTLAELQAQVAALTAQLAAIQ